MLDLDIDVRKAISYTETLSGHVTYGWGDKLPNTATLEQFLEHGKSQGIDCSGYIAWLLAQCSNQKIIVEAYSVSIGDYFDRLFTKTGQKQDKYSEVGAKQDNVLRICGFDHGGTNRHVWATVNGMTCESHGGTIHRGVDRRAWNSVGLDRACQWCYPIALMKPPLSKISDTPVDLNVLSKEGGEVFNQKDCIFLSADGRAFVPARLLQNMFPGLTLEFRDGVLTVRKP